MVSTFPISWVVQSKPPLATVLSVHRGKISSNPEYINCSAQTEAGPTVSSDGHWRLAVGHLMDTWCGGWAALEPSPRHIVLYWYTI